MLNTISARDARDNFTDLLGSVYYGREVINIEKKGRVFAVVINPEEYESLKRAAKAKYFETVDGIQEKIRKNNPDEIAKDIDFEVEKTRTKNYGTKNPTPAGN
jgi:prevent-host-death family protein